VLRICGRSLCRERVRASSGPSFVGAVPVASLADSYTEPTCRRARGGGITTIAPPKRIRQPGSNGTAQWRAVLYRQGSGRPLAKTPLAEGQLVSPANPSPGVPAAWTNPKTHKIVTKKTVRVRKPGIYYWQASVTLVKLGPAGSGRMQAYFDPPGSASARPYCDFH
jgi:hypothetical protein